MSCIVSLLLRQSLALLSVALSSLSLSSLSSFFHLSHLSSLPISCFPLASLSFSPVIPTSSFSFLPPTQPHPTPPRHTLPDRAWLRMTLNEQTMPTFLKRFSAQPDLTRQYYDDHAFLLDEERTSMMAMLFQGQPPCTFLSRVILTSLAYTSHFFSQLCLPLPQPLFPLSPSSRTSHRPITLSPLSPLAVMVVSMHPLTFPLLFSPHGVTVLSCAAQVSSRRI